MRGMLTRTAFMRTDRPRRLKECIGLVSLVEDDIRDEKRADHTLRLAARVVRPNCSWSNGGLEMVGNAITPFTVCVWRTGKSFGQLSKCYFPELWSMAAR